MTDFDKLLAEMTDEERKVLKDALVIGLTKIAGTKAGANARLIAAAPDLLEALKAAYALLMADDYGLPPRMVETFDAIRVAIQKAEGG